MVLARKKAAFSPMSPVNTKASSRPSGTHMAAMYLASR